MQERPILFSGPMVRAILAGHKTQTRRVVKPQPPGEVSPLSVGKIFPTKVDRYGEEYPGEERYGITAADGEWCLPCPFGAPGDRLWVRETWSVDAPLDQVRRENEDAMGPGLGHGPYFRADPVHENAGLTWRPSIFLPRWASRLSLEIAKVRAERLQAITEDDAKAEGCGPVVVEGVVECGTRKTSFMQLWDSINAKRGFGWAVNPWVWVIEFKVVA